MCKSTAAQEQLLSFSWPFKWWSCSFHFCRRSNLNIWNGTTKASFCLRILECTHHLFLSVSWRSCTEGADPHPTLQPLSQDSFSFSPDHYPNSWSICQPIKRSKCQSRCLQHPRAFFTAWSHSTWSVLWRLWRLFGKEVGLLCIYTAAQLPGSGAAAQPCSIFSVLKVGSSRLCAQGMWYLKFPLNWSNVLTQSEASSTNYHSLCSYVLTLQRLYNNLFVLIYSSV